MAVRATRSRRATDLTPALYTASFMPLPDIPRAVVLPRLPWPFPAPRVVAFGTRDIIVEGLLACGGSAARGRVAAVAVVHLV